MVDPGFGQFGINQFFGPVSRQDFEVMKEQFNKLN